MSDVATFLLIFSQALVVKNWANPIILFMMSPWSLHFPNLNSHHTNVFLDSLWYLFVVWSLSCVQLFYDPMEESPPGSSVHGISQARILELVAISFSRRSSQHRDWTCLSCIGRQILYHRATREGHTNSFLHINCRWVMEEWRCKIPLMVSCHP